MEKRTGKGDRGSPYWQRGRKPGANGQDYPFLGTGTMFIHIHCTIADDLDVSRGSS